MAELAERSDPRIASRPFIISRNIFYPCNEKQKRLASEFPKMAPKPQ